MNRFFPELDTVAAIPGFHAAREPDLPAIHCAGRTLTYSGLHRLSNQIARALDMPPGGRVAYLGQESVDYYATYFGCAKSGTVLVPINFRLTAPEVEHIVRDSGSTVLFVDPDLRGVADRLGPPGPTVINTDTFADWVAGLPDTDLDSRIQPADPLVQLYTSGTTGLPKGVVLAHRGFFAIRDALAAGGLDWIDWRSGDRSLIGIPGFHVGGIWWATQGFSAGITNIAMPRFETAAAVRLFADQAVTTACVVPSMLRLLLTEPGVDAATFRALRKIVYGGSPIAETLLREALPIFDCDFAQIYGLTETGNTAVCLPPEDHTPDSPRLRAAGRPYPGVSIKIIDPDGAELGVGEVGEVCLRTPARMLEYWRLPEATAKTLVDGWIHTGDAGRLDEDGYVYIQDRLKDMIIVAGENIYPTEIENTLTKHPAVADAAVIGVPDERFGEAVRAFVVTRAGHQLRARDLLVFCRERIAAFKIPTAFEFVEALPRNPSGKLLRRELRERFWADQDRRVN